MTEQDPYKTPEGNLVDADAGGYCDTRYFSISGLRLRRVRYLGQVALVSLIMYAIAIPAGLLMATGSSIALAVSGIVLFVVYVAAIWSSFALMIQRLHDLNRSGWFLLLILVPLVNFAFFIYMIFWPGTPGANNYGQPSPPNKTWHWIVGVVVPAVMIILSFVFMGTIMSMMMNMSTQMTP